MIILFIRRTIYIMFILLMLISILPTVYAQNPSVNDLKNRVHELYSSVVKAYYSGANVSKDVRYLNQAINLISEYEEYGDPTLLKRASALLDNVEKNLPQLIEEGHTKIFWNNIYLISTIIIISTLAVFSYFYLPRIYFRLWLRLRGSNRLRVRVSKSSRKSFIVDEEVWAVILAIIVVGGVFAVSQAYLSGRVIEPFSELGLLGKNMKIGDYPKNLLVGENATFYVYVGNHMGRPIYYIVEVKLGSKNTSIDPCPLHPIYTFEKILMNNETWIFRVDLPLEKPGLNQRIIVELWIYNESTGSIQYNSRWTQLWINVTGV